MDNPHKILQNAHSLFGNEKFEEALFLYAKLVEKYPQKKEFELFCVLSDIGLENPDRALSLFDYYTIALKDNRQNVVKNTFDIIEAYDGNFDKMMGLLKEFSHETTSNLDAIKYEEFEELIRSKGSFKIAFEDIMFSTKVALSSKDEFFSFVDKLIDNNFEETAYHYLDGFNEFFKYDKQLIELYNKLDNKKIDIKT